MKNLFKKHQRSLILGFSYILIFNIGSVVVPKDQIFANQSINPYLLINFILCSLWGLQYAFSSSLLFAGYFLILAKYTIDPQSIETIFSFYFLKIPIANTLISLVLGEIRSLFISKQSKLNNEVNELKNHLNIVEEQKQTLNIQANEFKKRIVNKQETIQQLYDLSKNFNSLDVNLLLNSLMKFLQQDLKITEGYLFFNQSILYNDKLPIFSHIGNKNNSNDMFSSHISLSQIKNHDSIIKSALQHKKMYWITTSFAQQQNTTSQEQASKVLIAAPILNNKEQIIGLLIINQIHFINYNQYNLKIMSVLIEWINASMKKIIIYNQTKTNNILDDKYNIFTTKYLKERLEEEFDRAQKFMLPLTTVLIKFEVDSLNETQKVVSINYKEKAQAKIPEIKKVYASIISSFIRKIDSLCLSDDEDQWCLICPLIAPDELQDKLKQIETEANEIHLSNSGIIVSYTINEYQPSMKSYRDILHVDAA